MTKLDWKELTKLTDRLAVIFERHKFTLAEIDEVADYISQLLNYSGDKKSLLKAIKREGSLIKYQKERKARTMCRTKYQTSKSKALQKIRSTRQNIVSGTEITYFIFQKTLDFWTDELSRTTKWKIKKELELDDIRIIQDSSEIHNFY